MVNENSLKNLKPIPKGTTLNPNGRPKSVRKALKDVGMSKEIPADAKARIYATLHQAIACKDYKEVGTILTKNAEELGEYGLVLQLAAKSLVGKRGWKVLNDILDRLFGKPIQQTDITSGGKTVANNIQVEVIDNRDNVEQNTDNA